MASITPLSAEYSRPLVMASMISSRGNSPLCGRYTLAISNSSISALASASLVRRTANRLGTRLRRRQFAPRITGIWLRSGSASVHGLMAAEVRSSTTLRVIASSKPVAVSTWRIFSNTRSSRRRAEGTIGTPTSSGMAS